MDIIHSNNFKKIFDLVFLINVILITVLSSPFVFSISLSDTARYSAILLFFLLASLYSNFWKQKIKNLLFCVLFCKYIILSMFFSENFNSGYLILFIHFFIFVVLYHVLNISNNLGKYLTILIISLSLFYALFAICGFVYFNFYETQHVKEIQLYQLFGYQNYSISADPLCLNCVIASSGDLDNGYRYKFNEYFGFFANVSWLNTSISRYVGIAYEPSLTALIFLIALVLLDNIHWSSEILRKVITCILVCAGIATMSMMFYVIIIIYLISAYLISLKHIVHKLILISLLLSLIIFFFDDILSIGSISARYKNIINVFDYMFLNFTIVDFIFGKGALWFSGFSGINSGYLSLLTQYGMIVTLLTIILWFHASKFSVKARLVLFLCPLVLNAESSIIIMVLIALLLHQVNSIMILKKIN